MKRWMWSVVAAGLCGTAWGSPAVEQPETAPEESLAPAPVAAPAVCGAVEEGLRLLSESALPVPENAALRRAVLEAVLRAGDPDVVFDEEGASAPAARWDTGLTLVATGGAPKIAAVRTNSPAAAAGLKVGDGLEEPLSFNSRWIGDVGLASARAWLAGGTTPECTVTVLPAAADDATTDVVEGKKEVILSRQPFAEASLVEVERLPAGIAYLRLDTLRDGSSVDILNGLRNASADAEAAGAILDLRGADGDSESAVAAVCANLERMDATGRLYSVMEAGALEPRWVSASAPSDSVCRLPLMVLVDGGTTGAAELLAAVLGGSVKGAMVIGRPTAGNPLVRAEVSLSIGGRARLAVRRVTTVDGAVYDGSSGVVPDVVITDASLDETVFEPEKPVLRKGKTLSEEEIEDKALRDRTRHDTYLRRATDVLLGLRALGYESAP